MKYNVNRTEVWAVTIEDRPGGLAAKLAAIADAGANLEFIVSRRTPEQPGKGVVFVTPLKGAKQIKAAQSAGFQKSEGLHSVRVEGMDKPGLGVGHIRCVYRYKGYGAPADGDLHRVAIAQQGLKPGIGLAKIM